MNIQLSDDFAAGFDRSTWTTDIRRPTEREVSRYGAKGGVARLYAETGEPPGPGVIAYSGFATRKRLFHPNLTGDSLFEVTLLGYDHDGEFLNKHLAADGTDAEEEDPLVGRYQAGFCLAIGSYQGLVGSEPDKDIDRIVQIHCDW